MPIDFREDLDIKAVSKAVIGRTYAFEVKTWRGKDDIFNALMFARQQLIEEIARKGYNVLLYERYTLTLVREAESDHMSSWRAIVHRRGKEHRVEVRYSGRRKFSNRLASFLSDPCITVAARISGAVKPHHDSYPPCLGVLQSAV